ncbi:MAG: 30S ribosomal protein S4 [Candidatus Zambryskibacteria bacterium CG10_big_fil_rev_8_21_14_0_10_42_12]|uniref:Small ribosomal subunit protein uS4 n=1 Tax=Candidatus Zambryskibacteria bacterium CG10_big_fil_rev_8_21_14_0_10_42_12 TaxID=1975115 RepID=A0A2H0QVS0_9BACT|nr:MAG: 30S ribosomal protein S4 [Candidatus Zambryskibacteria bacterium CG10_big_fil_rev_8_21_14_0_10_42_12]
MRTGPKYKIARRVGAPVFEKTQTQKFALSEQRKTKTRKRGRAKSDFGLQLNEKQKARYVYGLSEKQFRNYVLEAIDQKKVPATQYLYSKLERRIDNIVYRAGLASTRRFARQMVSHGHIMVNGRRITIPSHILTKGDAFSVRAGSQTSKLFTNLAEESAGRTMPNWMTFDIAKFEGGVKEEPQLTESQDLLFNLNTIIEFYSK